MSKRTEKDLKALESIKKYLDKFKYRKPSTRSIPHVKYKDYDLYTYEDIHELYGYGEITELKFNKLTKQLEDKKNKQTSILENQKFYMEYLKQQINDEIRNCLKDLGYSNEEIIKYMLEENKNDEILY